MKAYKWLTLSIISLGITSAIMICIFNTYYYDLILFDNRNHHSINIEESKLAKIYKYSYKFSKDTIIFNKDTLNFAECWVENAAQYGNFRTKPKNIKYNEYLLVITYKNKCHSSNQIFAIFENERIGELSRGSIILVNYSLLFEQQSKKDTIQIDLIANEDTANFQKLILIKNKN